MHSQTYIAAACALLGAVAASPAQDGMATYTHIDYVTELVTSTVWVDASDPRANQTPAPVASASKAQHDVMSEHSHSHGDNHGHGHSSSSSSSAYTAPSPTPAVPVAQTTSSHVVVAASAPAVSSSSIVAPPPPPPATTLSTSVVAPVAPVTTPSTTQPTVVATSPAVQTTAAANIPVQAAPASSSPSAVATQGSGSGSGKHYTNARLTFYDPKGGYGSCGSILHSSDKVVALNAVDMDALGKANVCGKSITISVEGKTATATIADTCPGCPAGGLDLTSLDSYTEADGMWKALDLKPGAGHYDDAEWWFN